MDFTPIARKLLCRNAAKSSTRSLETESIQRKILGELLHAGAHTRYGRSLGVSGKESYAEFRDRFPMTGYEEIRGLVMDMIRGEKDVLWPGRCRYFAQSSGTSGGKSKYIPITGDSLRLNHYRGAADTVGYYLLANPESRMFSGYGLILGGSFSNELPSSEISRGVRVGDLSATLIDHVPGLASMFRIPSKRIALMEDWEEKLPAIAKAAENRNITNISGVPSWFMTLIRTILRDKGATSLSEVWPSLEVFFHGGISFVPYREEYRRLTEGCNMHFVENYNASEGFFACQDRLDIPGMLLLIDAGIFFEFLPLGADSPVPVWEVTQGEVYELVMTSVNGLWRYRLGDTVKIESTAPVRITIAGRTKSFINAFGEEVMEYNADNAISQACAKCDCAVANYTVAPVYASEGNRGRHQWLIEWQRPPRDIKEFASELDRDLQSQNSDYQAKRAHDIFLALPEVVTINHGVFDRWLAQSGNKKLGGQRKIPRLSNDRKIADCIIALNSQ